MNATKADRLYNLLPVIDRQRDAEQGYPLRALLAVINEQVDIVEDDIRQLYDNWFIETAQDWAVPYIGELVGYRLAHEAGEPGDINSPEGLARNKILIPRREVANTIRFRRRKGTLPLLEELSYAVAGWPARAVEFFKLLAWTQNINHLYLKRARTVDVRKGHALDLLDGPYDTLAHGHTVDVRRINSNHTTGRYNIPSVGLFACRLKSYPVTKALARNQEKNWRSFGFSPLGNDLPLFVRPQPEPDDTHIAGELNLPVQISRRVFDHHLQDYYGEDKSFAIWVNGTLVPDSSIVATDLTDWRYVPKDGQVAVDPVRGQMVFSQSALKRGDRVRVSYHYGFSADIGGGEYDRPMIQAPGAQVIPVGADLTVHRRDTGSDREGERRQAGLLDRLQQALRPWTPTEAASEADDIPQDVVIEIDSNDFISMPFQLKLKKNQSLQIRAANRTRPILALPDVSPEGPDAFSVTLAPGSRLTLDGLMITNRSVYVTSETEPGSMGEADCPGQLVIRHCTLVPGWGLDSDCNPKEPAEPSLELDHALVSVEIEHSILGAIQVDSDEVWTDPISIRLSDSILDASEQESDSQRYSLSDPGQDGYTAHARLTVLRSTVFGMLTVNAVDLAENSIFYDCVNVARRQIGCMRFCYVPRDCRTPKRYHCQPELAEQSREAELRQADTGVTQAELDLALDLEGERIRPQFTSVIYGQPGYCQLAKTCADEIKRGADDESEMGVFHDLFQPQREANLRARLDEYTPAGMNVGIIFVN